jgi:hypothetical protein
VVISIYTLLGSAKYFKLPTSNALLIQLVEPVILNQLANLNSEFLNDYTEQLISEPQHIGDFIFPSHCGQRDI